MRTGLVSRAPWLPTGLSSMESPTREARGVGSPTTIVVTNPVVNDITSEIEASLNHVKTRMRQFLRGYHRYPMPVYLTTSSALFSAKHAIASIINDIENLLKTTLSTMFDRSSRVAETPLISRWLLVHITEVLCYQVHDLSRRHVFHVPSSRGGFDVVFLDDKMMMNGRQIIYLCVGIAEENEEPARIELFRRGVGLEDPDRGSLQNKIITHLSRMLRH